MDSSQPSSFYLHRRCYSRLSDDERQGRMSDTEEAPSSSSSSSSSATAAMMIPGSDQQPIQQQQQQQQQQQHRRRHHRRHSSSSCSSSSLSSTPLSPTCSFNKMSVDSDDGGRSVSSSVGTWGKQQRHSHRSCSPPSTTTTKRIEKTNSFTRHYPTGLSCGNDDTTTIATAPKSQGLKPPTRPPFTTNPKEKNEPPPPERRTVRRTSLLLKSKALSRVMHQAEEEIHLADLEMRRENGSTQKHLVKSRMDDHHPSSLPPPPPSPYNVPLSHHPWSTSSSLTIPPLLSSTASSSSIPVPHNHYLHSLNGPTTMDYSSSSTSSTSSLSSSPTAYQCSKLNPEIEMTNFQFENLPSPMQSSFKSIKRKASEDRLWDGSASFSGGLKRRAVSPSVSLTGSPTLTAMASPTSPPSTSLSTSFPSPSSYLYPPSGNAAARPHPSTSTFNLHEASGGLSRMSLSE